MINNQDSDTDPYEPTHGSGGLSDHNSYEEKHHQDIAGKRLEHSPETIFENTNERFD